MEAPDAVAPVGNPVTTAATSSFILPAPFSARAGAR